MKILWALMCVLVMCIGVSCTTTDDYYPLAIGNQWVYRDSALSAIKPLVTIIETQIADRRLLHGRDVWVRVASVNGAAKDTSFLEEMDNLILVFINESDTMPDTLMSFPLEQGKTWTVNYFTTAKVVGKEEVTVLAGTYFDCWRIDYNTDQYYFAPNVGMVKMIHFCSVVDNLRQLESVHLR